MKRREAERTEETKIEWIKNADDFLDWMTVHQSYSAVFKKDAAAVLFYVEQMQYEIGSRDGELVRRKIGKEKVESYRYEDLIDDVDIWIFGKILDLNALRDDCRNDIERAVHESEYQKLKEDERRVGKLYEKTCYGKAVDVLAERLAEKLFDNILKGKYKQEIQDMAEKICSFAEEEKRYGR